jgi:hypothetical protein
LDVNELKAITPAEDEKKILKFEFSPDEKHIIFISSPEKSSERRSREEAKDDAFVWGQDREFANLCLVSTESEKSRSYLTRMPTLLTLPGATMAPKLRSLHRNTP